MAVAGEIEGDDFLFAGLLAHHRFVKRGADGAGALRRGEDALGLGELHRGREGGELLDGARFDVAVLDQRGYRRCHAVVAHTAGVDLRRAG